MIPNIILNKLNHNDLNKRHYALILNLFYKRIQSILI